MPLFHPTAIFLGRPEVGTGTELHFSNEPGHELPNLEVCAVHLAVCAVVSACGSADILNKLVERNPVIAGPVAGQYTTNSPISDRLVTPYFERHLLAYVPPR